MKLATVPPTMHLTSGLGLLLSYTLALRYGPVLPFPEITGEHEV
jgi:hypothetical protein